MNTDRLNHQRTIYISVIDFTERAYSEGDIPVIFLKQREK